MADRVSSEDPSITTFRASVERRGGTRRPQLVLPDEAAEAVPPGVHRLVLGGRTVHADVRAGRDGAGPVVHGAYDNARLARTPGEGENHLPGWLDDAGVALGRSVLVDVVAPGFLYGVRPPAETAVYDAVEPPQSSLADIAAGLDE